MIFGIELKGPWFIFDMIIEKGHGSLSSHAFFAGGVIRMYKQKESGQTASPDSTESE